MQFGTEATMNTQELLVHDGSQRKATERLDTGIVNSLRVLVLAFEFEGKVVSQVTAFVVSSE